MLGLLISIRETSQELDFWSNHQNLYAILDHWPLFFFEWKKTVWKSEGPDSSMGGILPIVTTTKRIF